MSNTTDTITTAEADQETVAIDLGNAADLTEGQGGGNSEDKRRAYNC